MRMNVFLAIVLWPFVVKAASNEESPFYRNQFVSSHGETCARRALDRTDVSSFYKNQFVVTEAEACAAATVASGAASSSPPSKDASPRHRGAVLAGTVEAAHP